MALIIKDRVKETTTTTGTGNVALGGAVSNFVTFSSVLSDSDTTYYAIVDSNNSDFEVGLGTYVSSGNTIARTTVLASSNSGSAVSLSAGSKVIFCAFPADKAVVEDADGVVSIENLQFDTNAMKATNTNGNVQLTPNGTGFVELVGATNAGTLRFNCESNSHGVTLKGPPHSASATYSLELPNADGSAGQLLKTDGSGKLAFTSDLASATATQLDITAQGDLRLQDSSGGQYVGLQAPGTVGSSYVLTLPAADGSANQILKTDGSGNLGFTTVASGGLTHLSTVTASGASTVDIETTFDSTYDAYKLIITDMTVGTDGAQVQGILKIGGSYITSGTYDFLHRRLGVDGSGQIYSNGFGNASNIIVAQSTGNDSYESANFEFSIYNPTDTAIRHVVRFEGSYYEDDNDIHYVYGIGQNSTTGALTGIRFQVSTGTISGKFRLYGITNG